MNARGSITTTEPSASDLDFQPDEIIALRVVRLSRLLERNEQRYSHNWRAVKSDRSLAIVTTAGGQVGLGELAAADFIVGAGRCVEWISQRVVGRRLADAMEFSRPSGSSRSWDAAAAGVDSAIHDAVSQLGELPLNQNLNPVAPTPVRTVADAGCCLDWAGTTDVVLEEAAACAAYPFAAYSLRLGTTWQWNGVRPHQFLSLAWEVRSELGSAELVVDAEERLTTSDAIELAEGLSEIGCVALRRPFPMTALDSYRELAASSSLPVTAGGALTTYERLLPFLEDGLLGGIEFEIGLCGVSEAYKRCLLAEEYTLPVHAVGDLGTVGALASAHVLAATSADGQVHLPYSHGILGGGILEGLLTLNDGKLELGGSPGIGIILPSNLEAAFPWIEGSANISVNRAVA